MSPGEVAGPTPEVPLEEFTPEWTVHAGALIQREIDAAGYPQTAVAARTGISAKHLNQLLRGHVALSPDVAIALERVLGSPGDLWLRMDATWQAARLRATARDRLQEWTQWLHNFPTSVLVQRAIWREEQTASERVDALLNFFGVVSPDAFETVWLRPQANFRRSQKFDVDPFATAIWLRLVEATVESVAPSLPAYDETVLRDVLSAFPRLTMLKPEQGIAKAKKLLALAGVVLVLEPEVGNTRICGVSRRFGDGHPVIALTGRQKYLDVLWFTLLHEIGHVLLHPKRSTFLELDASGRTRAADDEDLQESAADDFAAQTLFPSSLRSRVPTLRTVAELKALAADAGVGVGVVAGRYGHETKDWPRFGKQRERVDIAQMLKVVGV